MMNNELSAFGYSFNQQIYFGKFEILLSKIAICYNLMLQDKVQLPNNENKIRNILLNKYINNPEIKRKLEIKYFIYPEVPETESIGRTDIRINKPDTYYNQNEEYYIIECKRLDNKATKGISGLNAEYIKNGICRFVSNYYMSFYKVNAMIGFVVTKMDIHKNKDDINFLLSSQFPEAKTLTNLSKENFIPNFDYHYCSTHRKENSSDLCLYHLMFDFSKNII
jgi:hypothetical protein